MRENAIDFFYQYIVVCSYIGYLASQKIQKAKHNLDPYYWDDFEKYNLKVS